MIDANEEINEDEKDLWKRPANIFTSRYKDLRFSSTGSYANKSTLRKFQSQKPSKPLDIQSQRELFCLQLVNSLVANFMT